MKVYPNHQQCPPATIGFLFTYNEVDEWIWEWQEDCDRLACFFEGVHWSVGREIYDEVRDAK